MAGCDGRPFLHSTWKSIGNGLCITQYQPRTEQKKCNPIEWTVEFIDTKKEVDGGKMRRSIEFIKWDIIDSREDPIKRRDFGRITEYNICPRATTLFSHFTRSALLKLEL